MLIPSITNLQKEKKSSLKINHQTHNNKTEIKIKGTLKKEPVTLIMKKVFRCTLEFPLRKKKSAIPGPIATSCEIVNSHAGREMSQGRSLGDDKPEVGSGWQMARVLAHQQMGRCPLNGGIDGARHGNRLAMQMNAFFACPSPRPLTVLETCWPCECDFQKSHVTAGLRSNE